MSHPIPSHDPENVLPEDNTSEIKVEKTIDVYDDRLDYSNPFYQD